MAFNNCTIVRLDFCRFTQIAWVQMSFPMTMKRKATINVYKKGSNEKPGKFQPIMLQPLLSKVFTVFGMSQDA